jgi:alpha-tubulin suppressor-like RCC1 family protein
MTSILNIIEIVSDKIANATTGQEVLFLSKIIEKLKVNKIKTVTNYYDMFDNVYSIGDLYFVESENSVYYSLQEKRILLYDGSPVVFSWGKNNVGQLGTGITTYTSSPVSIVGGFVDWIQVSAGAVHSIGLRSNGTAWGWGGNALGQLGDGTAISKSSPVSVVGGFTDWVKVSAGSYHNLGLRANGAIWSWGINTNGQLGDGTILAVSSPVSVVGGFTDWVDVSASISHSLAIRKNGTAWAWGLNSYGRLGDGTITSRVSPVSVIGGFKDWIQLSAGGAHSVGLRENGTIWSWGSAANGRLGDNTAVSKSSPVSVVGGFTDWIQVNAGYAHNLAVRANGTAWAWGSAIYGRLGDGTTTSRSSPVSVIGGFTDWVKVSAGQEHSLGLRANGTTWAWGRNLNGRLGNGISQYTNQSSPTSVIGGFSDWVDISASAQGHSSALRNIS